jgi:hypothetical protein
MSDTSTPTHWTPLEDAEAAELIGEGIHTGLRKGTEAPSAMELWTAISESDDGAWSEALTYLIEGLTYLGYKLCALVPDDEVDVPSSDADTGG